MIKTILIDLDGTLLPMDQEVFTVDYFSEIGKKFITVVDPKVLTKAIWAGTKAMVVNDGTLTNKERFWAVFDTISPIKSVDHLAEFDAFYSNEFNNCIRSTNPNALSNKLIKLLKQQGYELILATNPLFPHQGTESRIKWAGLDKNDFKAITTYEDCHYCKPNIKYYQEIISKFNLNVDECMMIGNDVDEDLVVKEIGMKCVIINDCLINANNKKIDADYVGSMQEVYDYFLNKKEM